MLQHKTAAACEYFSTVCLSIHSMFSIAQGMFNCMWLQSIWPSLAAVLRVYPNRTGTALQLSSSSILVNVRGRRLGRTPCALVQTIGVQSWMRWSEQCHNGFSPTSTTNAARSGGIERSCVQPKSLVYCAGTNAILA